MRRTPLEAQSAPDGEPLCRSGVGLGSRQHQLALGLGPRCVHAGEEGGKLLELPVLEQCCCSRAGQCAVPVSWQWGSPSAPVSVPWVSVGVWSLGEGQD